MNLRWRLVMVGALVFGHSGCGSSRPRETDSEERPLGRWYTVLAGDSVDSISRRFGVPVDDIVELNGLVSPDRIDVGQSLFLFGVEELVRRLPKRERAVTRPHPAAVESEALAWPMTAGVVSSGFGPRWGRAHKGIDIAAEEGTPVYAAAAGEVIYADSSEGGYGNLVIVEHSGGRVTVYGHNSRILVDEGDLVRQGAAISEVGSTGRSTGPHLHFEVRQDGTAVDPLIHLPAR